MPVSRNWSGDVPSDLRNTFAGCFYGAGAGGFVCRQRFCGRFVRRGRGRFCLPATLLREVLPCAGRGRFCLPATPLREVFLREAARIPFFLPVFYRRFRKVFVRGAFSVNFCAFFALFSLRARRPLAKTPRVCYTVTENKNRRIRAGCDGRGIFSAGLRTAGSGERDAFAFSESKNIWKN